MEGAAGGSFCFLHRIVRKKVREFGDQAGAGKSFFDVVAFEVDVGIDFVSEAVVALVAFESDIVSGGANPESFAVDGERRLPDAQMIASFYDVDGLSVSPAVILWTAEKI